MKKMNLPVSIFVCILLIALLGCPQPIISTVLTAGDQQTFTADSLNFKMIYVPGKTAPTGMDDAGTPSTVSGAYMIGETEVTYELWYIVYCWATSIARGTDIYTFANYGSIGRDGTGSVQQPVTTVNWRDCLVFCNAATEWYNTKKGTNYGCVYKVSGIPIRDSSDGNGSQCDGVIPDSQATGFRLLSKDEWELAARWRNDATNTVAGYSFPWFTKGNSASGAIADFSNSTATRAVAVYSTSATAIVKSKIADSLGIYDMSGNVYEWCFDLSSPNRIVRGGSSENSEYDCQVGCFNTVSADSELSRLGFRLAKAAP
jgi:sulfatase modifying factor 1